MRRRLGRISVALCALTLAQVAESQELLATPSGQLATVGAVVEVEVRHQSNNHLWLGGSFSVAYSDGVELIDFHYTDATDPLFQVRPYKRSGLLAEAGVANFNGIPDETVIMRLWFRVLREGVHEVTPSATLLQNPEWASAIDFGVFVEPIYRKAFIATPSPNERDLTVFDDLEVASSGFSSGAIVRTTLPVMSSGSAPLSITDMSVVYGGRDDFYVEAENCTAAPLQPGDLCEAQIAFRDRDPLAGATRRASLAIESDASTDTTRKVRLKTEVFVRDMRLSQELFDDVPAGGSGQIYSLFLVNAGEAATTIDEFGLTDQFGAVTFSIVQESCSGATLSVGSLCYFDLHIVATQAFTSPVLTYLLLSRDGGEYPEYLLLRALPPTRKEKAPRTGGASNVAERVR